MEPTIPQSTECARDYIHVADLATAHLQAFARLGKDEVPERLIYNVGSGRGFSVREVISAAAKLSGKEIRVKEAPRRAGDPANAWGEFKEDPRGIGLATATYRPCGDHRKRVALASRPSQRLRTPGMTMLDALNTMSHRRFNPLTGEWILVSPQRTQRPWQGQVEKAARPAAVEYDPTPISVPETQGPAARGIRSTTPLSFSPTTTPLYGPMAPRFAKTNRISWLSIASMAPRRVLCFSHTTIPPSRAWNRQQFAPSSIRVEQYSELGAQPEINYVQIFENRGEIMGASNPHPQAQIWANSTCSQ